MKDRNFFCVRTAFSGTVVIGLLLVALLSSAAGAQEVTGAPDRPVNVIVMVADGWGFNQVDAASYYQYGEKNGQVYHRFPVKMAVATFPYGSSYDTEKAWTDFRYVLGRFTDSAAAATALSTGVKTGNGRIGVDRTGKPLKHMAEGAKEAGMAAGVVTNVMLSHATPAGFSAHNPNRQKYAEIGQEMIERSELDVIMGAGHPYYDNNCQKAGKQNFAFVGSNLVWSRLNSEVECGCWNWSLVEDREDFLALCAAEEPPARVLGIPKVLNSLQFNRKGSSAAPFDIPLNEEVPSLKEMSLGALNILSQNPRGFFVMIEGGTIDKAAHQNNGPRMIEAHVAYDEAVAAVVEWVQANSSWDETLLVLVGDHETGYLTGPGSGPDAEPKWKPIENRGKGTLPGMEWHSGGHTNSLVPLFAKGVGAERFREYVLGTDLKRGDFVDNTSIAKVGFSLMKARPAPEAAAEAEPIEAVVIDFNNQEIGPLLDQPASGALTGNWSGNRNLQVIEGDLEPPAASAQLVIKQKGNPRHARSTRGSYGDASAIACLKSPLTETVYFSFLCDVPEDASAANAGIAFNSWSKQLAREAFAVVIRQQGDISLMERGPRGLEVESGQGIESPARLFIVGRIDKSDAENRRTRLWLNPANLADLHGQPYLAKDVESETLVHGIYAVSVVGWSKNTGIGIDNFRIGNQLTDVVAEQNLPE